MKRWVIWLGLVVCSICSVLGGVVGVWLYLEWSNPELWFVIPVGFVVGFVAGFALIVVIMLS